jgi:hypothetical protein
VLLKTPLCPQDSGYGGSGEPRRSKRFDDLEHVGDGDDTDNEIPPDGDLNKNINARKSLRAKEFMDKLNIKKKVPMSNQGK